MAKVIAISAGLIGIIWILVGGPCVCAAADAPLSSATHSSLDSLSRVSISDKIARMPVTSVADILRTQVGITVRGDRFHIRGSRAYEVIYTVGPDHTPVPDPLGQSRPAPPWQMLDVLYRDGGLPPGMDGEPSEFDFDLDADGEFDLLDVVMSIDRTTSQ